MAKIAGGTTTLAQMRVLVVEDEYFIADDMVRALRKLGAEVVGPVPTKEEALTLIHSGESIHAGVLDINLQGDADFSVADTLTARGVPFVFATGYDDRAIPAAYKDVPRWEKPFEPHDLALSLPTLLQKG